jgi:bifunctional DNase/RNase
MRELDIAKIGVSPLTAQRVIILKDRTTERYLPIWIGSAEADAIATKLQGENLARPLSHDLLLSVIGSLKASVDSVIINDIIDDIFYGEIVLNVGKGKVEIDSRPSDAPALAIRAEVPIFAEEKVLDIAGISVEKEDGGSISHQPNDGKPISEEELKRMSAFTDFINTLNIDDLGENSQKK